MNFEPQASVQKLPHAQDRKGGFQSQNNSPFCGYRAAPKAPRIYAAIGVFAERAMSLCASRAAML